MFMEVCLCEADSVPQDEALHHSMSLSGNGSWTCTLRNTISLCPNRVCAVNNRVIVIIVSPIQCSLCQRSQAPLVRVFVLVQIQFIWISVNEIFVCE